VGGPAAVEGLTLRGRAAAVGPAVFVPQLRTTADQEGLLGGEGVVNQPLMAEESESEVGSRVAIWGAS
jgi:hypothetical protein